MGNQWLIQRGIWTESAADTLLGYAYMQPGVEKVQLEIDLDEAHQGASPKITFKVNLEKSIKRKYLKINELNSNRTALNKLKMLWLMKRGTPSPGSIESIIRLYAGNFVGKPYSIEVLIEK